MDSASAFHLSFGNRVDILHFGQRDPGTAESCVFQRASLDREMALAGQQRTGVPLPPSMSSNLPRPFTNGLSTPRKSPLQERIAGSRAGEARRSEPLTLQRGDMLVRTLTRSRT